MKSSLNRRELVARLAAAGVCLNLPVYGSARSADATLTVTPLAERLTLIAGGGGNVTVFNSPEGVLLVDGGSREASARVLAKVREITGARKVHTLFNTHWHWDQTGSNTALGAAGTRIMAHENTRLWLGTRVDSKWERRVYDPLPRAAQPTRTFYTAGKLAFGGEDIEYGPLGQAHTDGDIYVLFRKAGVLVAGDVVSVGSYPILDYCSTGWIGGMATAAKTLLDLSDSATRIVPGTGAVQTRVQLAAEQDMLATLRQRLAKLLAQGMSVQDMLAAKPTSDYDAHWGDPSLFIANAWQGLVQRARELGVSIV